LSAIGCRLTCRGTTHEPADGLQAGHLAARDASARPCGIDAGAGTRMMAL
jgi:hypothetical protein